jgi:hypothetical protein
MRFFGFTDFIPWLLFTNNWGSLRTWTPVTTVCLSIMVMWLSLYLSSDMIKHPRDSIIRWSYMQHWGKLEQCEGSNKSSHLKSKWKSSHIWVTASPTLILAFLSKKFYINFLLKFQDFLSYIKNLPSNLTKIWTKRYRFRKRNRKHTRHDMKSFGDAYNNW